MLFSVESAALNIEYDSLLSIQTKTSAGWSAFENTKLIPADGKVGFSSSTTNIGGEYLFTANWSSLGYSPEEFILLVEINVNDAKLLKKSSTEYFNGEFYLYADGIKYSWSITDLSLKSGKNSLVLNFRTADKLVFDEEKTEQGTENVENSETTEENTEASNETENTEGNEITDVAEEKISDRFGFEFTKIANTELTVLFSKISVSVISAEDDEEEVEPITDNYTETEMIVAVIIALLVIAGIVVLSAMYAKKEAKRIRREIKKQKRRDGQIEQTEKDSKSKQDL